jgi:hypothetical protein
MLIVRYNAFVLKIRPEIDHLQDVGEDGRIMLKGILRLT